MRAFRYKCIITCLVIGLSLHVVNSEAAVIEGDNASVEVIEGGNGKIRVKVRLVEPDSGGDGTINLAFGTGLPTDGSQVTLAEPPVKDNKLQLKATKPEDGIDDILEIEILDGKVARFSFPSMAPARPDIAFVFDMAKLEYTKALTDHKVVDAVMDEAGRHLGVNATGGYWVYYGSATFPPLIFTGFSQNRTTYHFSSKGTIGSFYNSDETVAVSFLPLPNQESRDNEEALKEAARAFVAQYGQ